MFRKFVQRLPSRVQARTFSVKAIYSNFPATLYYYSPQPSSSLFDHKDYDSRPEALYQEGLVVARNGLVYPGVDGELISNGAVMFPNTFNMQEDFRRYFDQYCEHGEESSAMPQIYVLPKGTAIPRTLVLLHESSSRFSLQPSRGMPIATLNKTLDEFFATHATKEDAGEWIDKHPYPDAVADSEKSTWMAK